MNDPAQHDEWHRLFSAALNDTMTEAEKTQLATALKTSAEARQLWFLYQDNECGLGELKPRGGAGLVAPSTVAPRRSAWIQWRPLTAAAAGLVIGLFSASMVWGYVVPYAGRAVTLLQDSFESGPPPLVTGVPVEAGRWSGDYSEVVGEFRGVKPASGAKMLRFLRADYEGKPGRDGYIADVFRIIDLRGAELGVDRGDACVSVEARFRALPYKNGAGRVRCNVTVYALDALPEPGERHQFYLKPKDGLPADGDDQKTGATILATATRAEVFSTASDTWQAARTELRVPPDTRFFMVHLHEWLIDSRGPREPQPVKFEGLFVDDVRATLTHQPPLP